ncbi:MAG: prepilin-type N-terminal cleavage/methylation domain-containing protein [Proteobacteria bacterium]|jgi:prepilin-type N-terminal cleavage/methylation domain-containing protein|nr:prepilin-type N-terminal cleavage/methylation domain-containing protein [Alphaproteobacteria bacterium]NCC03741.1 prepilin-type N-terminal cleavage/methylation domain-containing protein [Pseudomonadota bacterium]
MRKETERGFTLVELSIVLVIIGLIIGGVLTGRQIILNARITNAVNGIQAYQAQFQTYQQNNGSIPGDDPSALTRFPSLADYSDVTNGNNNGRVGTATSFDTTDTTGEAAESRSVWAHLRAAGLVTNQVTNGTTAVQPTNPFGGVYGFQNGAFGGIFTTTTLCLSKVTAGAAQAIDSRLDDGVSNAGSIQASEYTAAGSTSETPITSYSDDKTYNLCVRM